MNRITVAGLILLLIVIVVVGVSTHAVIGRLSDQVIWALVGGAAVLAVVVGVGILFIVKDLAQAYITRRMLAQDEMADLRQMAMLTGMLRSANSSNIRLQLPPGQHQPDAVTPWLVQQPGNSVYRDTISGEEVEIE